MYNSEKLQFNSLVWDSLTLARLNTRKEIMIQLLATIANLVCITSFPGSLLHSDGKAWA